MTGSDVVVDGGESCSLALDPGGGEISADFARIYYLLDPLSSGAFGSKLRLCRTSFRYLGRSGILYA